jgi:hypothetical protein
VVLRCWANVGVFRSSGNGSSTLCKTALTTLTCRGHRGTGMLIVEFVDKPHLPRAEVGQLWRA